LDRYKTPSGDVDTVRTTSTALTWLSLSPPQSSHETAQQTWISSNVSILALRPCTTAHTRLDPAFFALAALTLRGRGSGGGSGGRGNGTRDHSGGGGLQVSGRCQQMRPLYRGGAERTAAIEWHRTGRAGLSQLAGTLTLFPEKVRQLPSYVSP
jgi:hypothetical protein